MSDENIDFGRGASIIRGRKLSEGTRPVGYTALRLSKQAREGEFALLTAPEVETVEKVYS